MAMIVCFECGKEISDKAESCVHCGCPITKPDFGMQELDKKSKKLEIKQQRQAIKDQKKMARCPKCGSTSLSGHKRGYGIGKGVIGAAIAGPIGLVAGNLGAKKVKVTCMNCGKQFKA